jgi:hypothetical protein
MKECENCVLRRIFGVRRVELTGEWNKLHSESLDICIHHKMLFGSLRQEQLFGRFKYHYGGEERRIQVYGGEYYGKG